MSGNAALGSLTVTPGSTVVHQKATRPAKWSGKPETIVSVTAAGATFTIYGPESHRAPLVMDMHQARLLHEALGNVIEAAEAGDPR